DTTHRSPGWKVVYSALQIGQARAKQAAGKYQEARDQMASAVDLRRQAVGEEHPDYALALHEQARLSLFLGDHAGAEPLLRRALTICRQALGERHPETADCLSHLSQVCAATGRLGEAFDLARQAAGIQDSLIGQVFSIGSDSQRAAFLRTLQDDLDRFLSLAVQQPANEEWVRASLDQVLRRKGLRAEAQATQREVV